MGIGSVVRLCFSVRSCTHEDIVAFVSHIYISAALLQQLEFKLRREQDKPPCPKQPI